MKKTLLRSLLPLALLLVAAPLFAVIGTIDRVPAATLLLPYFEVGLDDPNAVNTVMTINNASASAAVAHVTLWTDLGVPTISFDVYLTGFDSATVDLRLVFEGILPPSADDGADPTDTASPTDGISSQGPLSQDINFPGSTNPCDTGSPARLTAAQQAHLQAAHTGQASATWGGMCGAVNHGDLRARGYVTVDSVTQCSTLFPNNNAYQTGVMDFRNILWGEYAVIERSLNLAYGDSLVHIEAGSSQDPLVGESGDYTFYGRYTGFQALDRREPLATHWFARYDTTQQSEVIAWRDSGNTSFTFACGFTPLSFPMTSHDAVAFDERENAATISPAAFPYATNRVRVNSPTFLTPFTSGVFYLNLNLPDTLRQSWVSVVQRTPGQFGTAWTAFPLDNASAPDGFVIND